MFNVFTAGTVTVSSLSKYFYALGAAAFGETQSYKIA
jgi:hypothetical protein